ncbi:helix-turn-helix transcriptional regulator [Nocardia cyriacigeorgica]|uniref:helix-turn-helix transcriptional regulator n=1 Tax=Nocardia cyriacigeorgica TaxID=135487 RepID=UPI0018949064|nr:LuxR family transcriptional regulator [Nocardia cyriacigeorgica]MBF6086932.1 LuxR family transcriptional regulator [Nocardia cyriacigeorgica]MBF6090745.1 LuxR family transcriptional regulator [Nocardia cyriacigeorgica]MBF6322363.1 LuxR family transcriptional regulator [Nocardia cyriacigeorgica]
MTAAVTAFSGRGGATTSITLQRFSDLVTAIHDAGADPTRWDSALGAMTAAFGAIRGLLVIPEPAGSGFVVTAAGAELTPGIHEHIVRAADRIQQLPSGAPVTSDEVLPPRDGGDGGRADPDGLANSFLARLDSAVPPAWICLTMPAQVDTARHSAGRALLSVLVPHLGRALRNQSTLIELTRERAVALATLEKARYGIMIVTADAAVIFANSAAMDITGDSDGLAADSSGRLRASPSANHARLSRLIREAADPDGSSGNVAITRPSGRRPLIVRVTPLDGMPGAPSPRPRAVLLLVVDPDHDLEPQPRALHDLYGLTEAETMVAMGVIRGDGLPAVADQLSVSLFTARTHLQHIFVKTGTHRQAELVRLLLSSAIAAQ